MLIKTVAEAVKMSDARQRKAQAAKEYELRKQEARDAEKAETAEKAAKLGTEAGQDPKNTNIYDTLADLTRYQKDYTRIQRSEARNKANMQEAQIEQAKQERAAILSNADQYTASSLSQYEQASGQYIQEATENLRQIEAAEAGLSRNVSIYTENIKQLEAASLDRPIYTRKYRDILARREAAANYVYPEPKTPQTEITTLEGIRGYTTVTPADTVFIDATDQTGISIGLEAKKQIESINPPAYQGYTRIQSIQGFEAYESRFNISTELRTEAARLSDEAREPLSRGKPADLLKLAASSGLDFTAAAYDAATAPIRPALAAKTLKGINETATPQGWANLGPALAANPTGLIFSAAGGYAVGAIGSAAFSSTITRSRYMFPSEIDDAITYPRPNYVQSTQYPKGTRLYTDYSGELRSYIPAAERWNQLVRGGDQFINDAVYTSLMQSRPVGTGADLIARPQLSFNFMRPISPVKVTTRTVTETLPQLKTVGLISGVRVQQIPEAAEIDAFKPRNDIFTRVAARPSVSIMPTDKAATAPDVKTLEIQAPVLEQPQTPRQRIPEAVLSLPAQPITAPQKPPPPPHIPRPTVIKPPTTKPPAIDLFKESKKKRRRVGGQLIGFYDKDYGVKDILGKRRKVKI